MYSLICIRINGWVNNGQAGDLRRHRAHYDVTVMVFTQMLYVELMTKLSVFEYATSNYLIMTTFKYCHIEKGYHEIVADIVFGNNWYGQVYYFVVNIGKEKTNLPLTHWGRVTHICVSKLTIIGSDNGLSPGRRQAIIWTNAGILLIGPLGTNFSQILVEIYTFSFKKMRLKGSSAKWRPFCLGLNVF